MKNKVQKDKTVHLSEKMKKSGLLFLILAGTFSAVFLRGLPAFTLEEDTSVESEQSVESIQTRKEVSDNGDGSYTLSYVLTVPSDEEVKRSEGTLSVNLSVWTAMKGDGSFSYSMTDAKGNGLNVPDSIKNAVYQQERQRIEWKPELENGVTYRISFSVIPDQQAYKVAAALQSGTMLWEEDGAAIDGAAVRWEEFQRIDKEGTYEYAYRTDSQAYVTYEECIPSENKEEAVSRTKTVDFTEESWLLLDSEQFRTEETSSMTGEKTAQTLLLLVIDEDTEEGLKGAQFTLEKKEQNGYVKSEELTGNTVSETGFLLRELTTGSYRLTQNETPEGYVMSGEPIYLEITGKEMKLTQESDQAILTTAKDGGYELRIYNAKSDEPMLLLPSTGSSGRLWYMLAGYAMLAVALGYGVYLKGKRKISENVSL